MRGVCVLKNTNSHLKKNSKRKHFEANKERINWLDNFESPPDRPLNLSIESWLKNFDNFSDCNFKRWAKQYPKFDRAHFKPYIRLQKTWNNQVRKSPDLQVYNFDDFE